MPKSNSTDLGLTGIAKCFVLIRRGPAARAKFCGGQSSRSQGRTDYLWQLGKASRVIFQVLRESLQWDDVKVYVARFWIPAPDFLQTSKLKDVVGKLASPFRLTKGMPFIKWQLNFVEHGRPSYSTLLALCSLSTSPQSPTETFFGARRPRTYGMQYTSCAARGPWAVNNSTCPTRVVCTR
jgi:hypothetical protein